MGAWLLLSFVQVAAIPRFARGRLELPAQAEAGEDRKTLHRLAARVVVAVLQPFLAAVVVNVLHVEVRGELPGLELPGLLDADARLMEQRVAGAVHAAVDRVVEVAVRVVDAADDGRARVAADQAERAAEVPAAPELVAAHQRQDVRLVVVEEAPGGAGVVALAARQRVRDEAERASCRVELAQHLEAVDAPLAAVDEQRVAVGADAVDLELGQALVEAFQAEGTGPAERLLDAEAVVLRTAEAE